jgi:hypothetical protein
MRVATMRRPKSYVSQLVVVALFAISLAGCSQPVQRCEDGTIVKDETVGSPPPDFVVGRDHISDEAAGSMCSIPIFIPRFLAGLFINPLLFFFDVQPTSEAKAPIGGLFPAWPHVVPENTQVLEGIVAGQNDERSGDSLWPHVAFQDFPLNHYTHDFTFHVSPDPAYRHLFGWQDTPDFNDPCANLRKQRNLALGLNQPVSSSVEQKLRSDDCAVHRIFHPDRATQQPLIEVEWESGLGASNDDNLCTSLNDSVGNSCGFATVGHLRRELIWNWPTVGDRVYIVGNWVWDRGHQPARTEIHPPRLMAIQRKLPVLIQDRSDPIEPGPERLAIQEDVYASGDGGALWNNRSPKARYVEPVNMSDRDYSFDVNLLPRPAGAELKWTWSQRPGDTFSATPMVEAFPDANPPHLHVTIPWKSDGVPSRARFERSLFAYWGAGRGIPPTYIPRVFLVRFNDLYINESHDHLSDGEYRVFVEIGGHYLFVNELTSDAKNIVSDGLGNTGSDEFWGIKDRRVPGHPSWAFRIYVPPGDTEGLRVHAGGWEADSVNDAFGKIVDPHHSFDSQLSDYLRDNLFNIWKVFSGCGDDPIGEVNDLYPGYFGLPPNIGVPVNHGSWAGGPDYDDPGCGTSRQDFSFRLDYTVTEEQWAA